MTNVQLISNQDNGLYFNSINDFKMALNNPLDCHNGTTFMKVNQIQYPQSIPNIDKDDTCWFSFQIEFNDFLLDASKTPVASTLVLSYAKQYISHGIYEIEDICDIINNHLDQFDIRFSIGRNNIVYFDYSYYYEYWCNQKKGTTNKAMDGGKLNEFRLILTSWSKKKKNSGIKLIMNFSQQLSYMLGFYEPTYEFEQKVDGKTSDYYAYIKKADTMHDKSDGQNFMYIICDEIEPIIFGKDLKKILFVAPINWTDQGSSDFVNYSPPNHLRRMSPGFHRQLSIRIETANGDLIPFDFGKISLDVEILKNV